MNALRFWLPMTLCFLTVLCSDASSQTEELLGFDSVVPTDQAYPEEIRQSFEALAPGE